MPQSRTRSSCTTKPSLGYLSRVTARLAKAAREEALRGEMLIRYFHQPDGRKPRTLQHLFSLGYPHSTGFSIPAPTKMSSIQTNVKDFNGQLGLRSYQGDGDRSSIDSRSTSNHNDRRNHIARRLFDNSRLDRKLKRHHITCASVESSLSAACSDAAGNSDRF